MNVVSTLVLPSHLGNSWACTQQVKDGLLLLLLFSAAAAEVVNKVPKANAPRMCTYNAMTPTTTLSAPLWSLSTLIMRPHPNLGRFYEPFCSCPGPPTCRWWNRRSHYQLWVCTCIYSSKNRDHFLLLLVNLNEYYYWSRRSLVGSVLAY